ncbi:MAG TPA: enoyl-CoA hydratase-related protein [archaeon]|nr:enoyl-CoA hydratase-related protein [archaeon]
MSEPKKYDSIIVKKDGSIAWLTLNRPHRLNTLSGDMIDEMHAALNDFEADKAIRCIVITGAGDKAFSAGADVTAFTGLTPTKAAETAAKGHTFFTRIERIGKPVIASINGFALGGGLEMALACDFRIAAENVELGQPETNLGLIPGWGGTQRLVRIVGLAKAKEMIMLAERVHAEEAVKMGLITKVVSRTELTAETTALANKLADGPPVALRLAKEALNLGTQVPLDIGLKLEANAFGIVLSTKDVIEGVSAFMSKRKPEFKGE